MELQYDAENFTPEEWQEWVSDEFEETLEKMQYERDFIKMNSKIQVSLCLSLVIRKLKLNLQF